MFFLVLSGAAEYVSIAYLPNMHINLNQNAFEYDKHTMENMKSYADEKY
jgi:hypothetical protein